MSKSFYVFSTLACDQVYQNYALSEGGVNTPTGRVLIRGGSGIANDRLITPEGVMTVVTEEEMAILEANHGFNTHKKGGFIVVQERQADADKVAADMARNDESKPLTPGDYEAAEAAEGDDAPSRPQPARIGRPRRVAAAA